MQTLTQDIAYALRTLAKSPGYAAVTILTLALGIGANTAIFSVVNGVLLKPLAYPKADQLQFITSTFPRLGFDRFWISVPEYVEFKQRNRSFQDVGGYREGSVNLGTPERPRRVNSALVTPELMSVLGVAPMRGRLFNEADAAVGAEDVGIIAATTWRSDFGGDETVVGRVVQIDGTPTRIVGIMPSGYDIHDERIEVYLPLTIDPKTFPNNRGSHFLMLIGRLKDGVTAGQARADVDSMVAQWRSLSGNSEAALAEYREANNAGSLDEKQNLVMTRLNQLSDTVTRVENERLGRQTVYDQLKNADPTPEKVPGTGSS
jgi:putative ABC transport system permease protein